MAGLGGIQNTTQATILKKKKKKKKKNYVDERKWFVIRTNSP